jgi:hypothetical protein
MLVRKVLTVEYDADGLGCESRWLANPTWEQIEWEIWRLDRFCHPFVWFYLNDAAQGGDVPEFEIIGGGGIYAIQATVNGKRWMYRDPTKGDGEVDVWTSDQGASVPEKSICSDTDAVLAITRHFCEIGSLHPDFDWAMVT